jgi:hypothetical protein
MCTNTSGAPNCTPDKANTEGGAMVMKVVGSNRCGHMPTVPMRTKTNAKATGHNTAAMPYCAAAQTGCPKLTPAKAGKTLPTTGMNKAGVMAGQKLAAVSPG